MATGPSSSDKPVGDAAPKSGASSQTGNASRGKEPEWANGLRQLYDSVVDEPLPDAFKDLLEKLDDGDPDGATG